MEKFYYDLHLHSCLSPCGDNDMTPNNIVNMALLNGMDIIALTDHNSCRNCRAAVAAGERAGLCVVPGMELCTEEEIHLVCLFPTLEAAEAFDQAVAARRPPVPNRPQIFGDQLVLNEDDQEVGREEFLLLAAASTGLGEAVELARSFGGAAFPAHIDRDSYSILSALGGFPPEITFTAAELSSSGDGQALKSAHPCLQQMILLRDSDAHYLENMPERRQWIQLPEKSAACLVNALNGQLPVFVGCDGEETVL